MRMVQVVAIRDKKAEHGTDRVALAVLRQATTSALVGTVTTNCDRNMLPVEATVPTTR